MIPKRLQCRQKIFSSKPDYIQFQDHAHVDNNSLTGQDSQATIIFSSHSRQRLIQAIESCHPEVLRDFICDVFHLSQNPRPVGWVVGKNKVRLSGIQNQMQVHDGLGVGGVHVTNWQIESTMDWEIAGSFLM